ncbi:hypothetical protein L6164_024268 [Bauhinia variegata]|uniref:Uncharacterized protein n=1 Tax=Bauhinia variegata TaxID=167791 RepID=A0ACB9LY74_BAUVA|nr:hypothetical protein L6164_024268 [Bauhinia variegata]
MATLSEAYRDLSLPLHHIIPLDFSSVGSLPDSHAWLQSDDEDYRHRFSFNGGSCSGYDGAGLSIPVIDLLDPNATELIGLACENWGAFQLRNHGISRNLIEEVELEAKHLFALPTEQKVKALRSPGGATGYGRARISPFFPKYMWHEGFTIMGSPSGDAKKIWPNGSARFCDLMEEYQKQMKVLAEQLTHIIFKFLNISEEEKINWVGSTNSTGAVQLNSYPCCPEPKRAMGLAPHTDTSLLTIVHQSQTTGLQIFKEGLGWVPVHPHPSALVVNIGDLFHIISNARFPCVLHRVTVNRTHQRYSVAYFYGPPVDYVVSPIPATVLNKSVARFRSVTVKEYIGIKAKNLGGALALISA